MKNFLKKRNLTINRERIKQYIFVVRELTGRELKRKYARSKLGAVWSILNPLLTMIVMSLIFSYMFRRAIENFPIYYICGHVCWDLFTQGTNSSMTALVDNKQMLIKVKIPMKVFIISRVYTALVNFGYSMIAFVPIVLFFRMPIRPCVLFLLAIVLCETLFVLGASYMLSTWYVYFGDLKHLYRIFTHVLMYFSALFYPLSRLPGPLVHVVANNPVYLFVDCLRWIVMQGVMPPTITIIKMIGWSITIYILGNLVINRNRNKIMQRVVAG